jgi:UDP:flavonoid glycosyltransferase YjiC (YdhE family)
MTTYLFATWEGGGNLPPAVAIGQELNSRGHDVRFLGHAGQRDRVEAAGLRFLPYRQAKDFHAAAGVSPLKLMTVFADAGIGDDVLAELDRAPADVVVLDCLLFGAMKRLRAAGRAYVAYEHTLDGYLRKAAKGPFGILLRLRGLKLIDAGALTFCVTLPAFDPDAGNVVHTGPGVRGTPAAPERPAVLLSLSTFGFASLARTWQRVLDAVDGLDARVIATTGPSIDAATLRVPQNVEVHTWLPHAEVLPEVSMVVGHGGHGTAMAALAHDLPVLVLPLDGKSDQPTIGRTIERLGAGRHLNRRSSPAHIRATIETLLADGLHRAAAADLGAQVRAFDGRTRSADLLESFGLTAESHEGDGSLHG